MRLSDVPSSASRLAADVAGHFITLEGGDCAGKTTQCAWLFAALATRRIPVVRTREPGGSPGAERLRGLLLTLDWTPQAETLLHIAARIEHVVQTIRPALDAGNWVICDRFSDSTMAYQGDGLGVDRSFIANLTEHLVITPDLTVVLDVPEAVAAERMSQRGRELDRYEMLDTAFHARVRKGFRQIASAESRRCAVVDATGPIEVVHAAIMAVVEQRFPDLGGDEHGPAR